MKPSKLYVGVDVSCEARRVLSQRPSPHGAALGELRQ